MSSTAYECVALTGGGANALDALAVASLVDGDIAFVTVSSGFYVFRFDAAATAAENTTSHPYVIRPDDYSAAGNWEEYITYSYRSAAGDPNGVITPTFIGQEYLNTTAGSWWKAKGVTNTDWCKISE